MSKIPTQTENPTGLHQRYYIQKVVKNPDFYTIGAGVGGLDFIPEFVLAPVDKNAEYFILRLDEHGKDQKHINACRKAVLTYAEEIREHLPELSNDLIKRYEGKNI